MPRRARTTALAATSKTSSPSSEVTAQTARTVERLSSLAAAGTPTLLACEATADGVLSAIGMGYLAHMNPSQLRLSGSASVEPTLFETTVMAEPDVDLARRVLAGLERTVSSGCPRAHGKRCSGGCDGECLNRLLLALVSDQPDMPQACHAYVRRAFKEGRRIGNLTAEPEVARVRDLSRAVSNECERMRQFVRFSHMVDGSYLAVHTPSANVLPLTVSHFKARMGSERFILVDPRHLVAALSDPTHGLVISELSREEADMASHLTLADDERYVRAMWKRLYDGLELPGRDKSCRGYDLRASWMAKRFWHALPELDPANDDPGSYVPQAYGGTPALPTIPPTSHLLS